MTDDELQETYKNYLKDCSEYMGNKTDALGEYAGSMFMQALIDMLASMIYTSKKDADFMLELMNKDIKNKLDVLSKIAKPKDE